MTLIEIEAIDGLKRDYEVQLDPGQSRRNIVTRGVALNHLVEQEFRIGDVVLRGTRLCEPCAHMEKLTVKGAMRGLIHRGGLRAEIIKGGTIGSEMTSSQNNDVLQYSSGATRHHNNKVQIRNPKLKTISKAQKLCKIKTSPLRISSLTYRVFWFVSDFGAPVKTGKVL